MKDVPFEAAKDFCDKYEKDQVIILSWDRETGDQWVTTYGKSDEDSAMACHGGNAIKDFLQLKREKDEIPSRFKKWEIESVDRYWYRSGRCSITYKEITFFYDPITLERKDAAREFYHSQGEKRPDWTFSCIHRQQLDCI